MKVEMAKGFLHEDHEAVERAEKKYYHLRDRAEDIWKEIKKHD